MQSAEIELKFPVVNLLTLHDQLVELGFHLETPRTFEQNTLFDTPERALRQRGQLLRLRQYGDRYIVTHKRHPDREDGDLRYKVRIETETEVAEGPAIEEIFRNLGYIPAFRYEKFRTEWSHPAEAGAHMVVDETPIGDFAELEGPRSWIDATIAHLGVDPTTCLTESYGRLFLDWKRRTGSPATDLTFVQIPERLPEFELIPS